MTEAVWGAKLEVISVSDQSEHSSDQDASASMTAEYDALLSNGKCKFGYNHSDDSGIDDYNTLSVFLNLWFNVSMIIKSNMRMLITTSDESQDFRIE